MRLLVFCIIFCSFVGCSSVGWAAAYVEAEQNITARSASWVGGHKVRICAKSDRVSCEQGERKLNPAKRLHGKLVHHK